MGAVIYLVISLKVEKSASDYRKNKFRKEMDSVITEFNSAAERNISLLENRIEIIRKLMEKSGEMQQVDYLLQDEEIKKNVEPEKIVKQEVKTEDFLSDDLSADEEISTAKKSLLLLKKKVIDKFETIASSDKVDVKAVHSDDSESLDKSFKYNQKRGSTFDYTIEKDLTQELKTLLQENKEETLEENNNEEENVIESKAVEESMDKQINLIVSETPDTYNLVAELNKIGCSTEEIAQHAGIPAGEVHLVLNLIQS